MAPQKNHTAKTHPYFKSLAERAKKLQGKHLVLALFALAAFLLLPALGAAKGLQLSALYLFADNGKKSGRTGGNVYMRNGRTRGFRVPALVRNAYTSIARTTLATFSSMWNTLTESERLSWLTSAGAIVSDRFAQPVLIKGKNLFVQLNANLFYAGQPPITDAPFIAGVSGLSSLTAAIADGGAKTISYTPTPTLAGQTGLVFATGAKNAGVYRPSQSAFRLIGVIPPGTAAPFDINAMYVAKFGEPATGQRVFIQVKMVANDSGLESAITQADTIVT